VFFTIVGGMATLVDALVAAIEQHGGKIETGAAPHSVEDVDSDGVVVAVPAPAAAALLREVDAASADLLAAIDYSSVTLVTFAFPDRAVRRPLDASGFLCPRPEGMLMTACSWASSKWSHLSTPGRFLLRVSAGRTGDERASGMTDDAVVAQLRDELEVTMDIRGEPLELRVHRWPQAFPQYAPGHLERIRSVVERLPGRIALAGAMLGGVGLPACIGTGRAAAARLRGEEATAPR
jgi:protoporphyrinogen/coproporphyrinogen III oxidase